MRTGRWVDRPKLVRVIRSAMRDAKGEGLEGKDYDNAVVSRVERYVTRLPDQPPLIGVTEAASMLGVPKPRIMRFRSQGRLPEALEVDGPSAPVYLRDEMEGFAREIQEGRDLRRPRSYAHDSAASLEA